MPIETDLEACLHEIREDRSTHAKATAAINRTYYRPVSMYALAYPEGGRQIRFIRHRLALSLWDGLRSVSFVEHQLQSRSPHDSRHLLRPPGRMPHHRSPRRHP